MEMVKAARDQLRQTELAFILDDGDAELTAIWQEGPIWCRGRMDKVSADRKVIVDLKNTTASAQPDAFIRRILDGGFDLQAATYTRAVQVLASTQPKFVLIVVETDPPYALSLVSLTPQWLALAERKRVAAVSQWAECMASGVWPSYPTRIAYADCPPWAEEAQMRRELMIDEMAAGKVPHVRIEY